jgi:hypothetical protein
MARRSRYPAPPRTPADKPAGWRVGGWPEGLNWQLVADPIPPQDKSRRERVMARIKGTVIGLLRGGPLGPPYV